MKDKDGNEKWVSKMAEVKDRKYCEKFREKYGKDKNPEEETFDPQVAMLAGGGRKNGRLCYVMAPSIVGPSRL